MKGQFAVASLLVAARPKPGVPVDARWLWLYLDHFRDQLIVPLMQGTANVNLKPADLAEIAVALPPLTEQRRIVDLMTTVDDAQSGGRVSAACRAAATGLMREVEAEAETWTRLRDVVSMARAGATPSRAEPAYWGGGIPWLKSGEVDAEHIKSTSEAITERGLAASSAWLMPIGTVVVAMYGQGLTAGSVGYTGVPMCSNQAVLGLVADQRRIDPRFLFHWLRSRKDSMRERRSGSSQPNLNRDLVLQERVPVIGPRRQRDVAILFDQLSTAAGCATALDDSLAHLREALVADLLSGNHQIPASYDRLLGRAA